jgi:hypothetical protein
MEIVKFLKCDVILEVGYIGIHAYISIPTSIILIPGLLELCS